MTTTHAEETIDALTAEIEELDSIVATTPSDLVLDGENVRELLIGARTRRAEDRAVWRMRLSSWRA